MGLSEGASLLTFLDAPVMVGDPEGRVVYVNPAFERRFDRVGNRVQGELLASLFSGGAREAVLRAVAAVCAGGGTERFRVREAESGFMALVSPILGDGACLGVVILLTDEPLADERVLVFHREMQEPLDELRGTLDDLLEQTGGRRNEAYRVSVESGLRALERAQKWSQALHGVLSGGGPGQSVNGSLDPVRVVQQSLSRVRGDAESRGIEIDLLLPGGLDPARGDAARVESLLVQLLRQRLENGTAGEAFAVSARADGEAIIISIVDPPRQEAAAGRLDPAAEPARLQEEVRALGGRIHTTSDLGIGRVTTLSLPAAE